MARKGYISRSLTLPDGSRKWVYGKTKEEADEKLLDLRLQMRMGVDLKAETPLGELIKMWYAVEVAPRVKENSALTIKSAINLHLMPLIGGAIAKDVTPMQVQMWLTTTGQLNKNAAKICMRALKGAYALAEENGLVYKSPVLARFKPGGVEYKHREAITPDEEEALLNAISGTRAFLWVWFALATGARRGEVCGLKWDCIDFDAATVTLKRNLVFIDHTRTELRDYMKTEAGTRVVPLPWDLLAVLREEARQTNSVFVFHRPDGEPYNANSFSVMWHLVSYRFGPNAKQTSRTHGVKTDTVVTPHVLRHTYATRCFENGMDVKEVQHLMGHADPGITLRIYTHYCESARQDSTFAKAREARSRTTVVPQDTVIEGPTGSASVQSPPKVIYL